MTLLTDLLETHDQVSQPHQPGWVLIAQADHRIAAMAEQATHAIRLMTMIDGPVLNARIISATSCAATALPL
jgi:hypothetical protein